MGRHSNLLAGLGLPPAGEYWRAINRQERQAQAQERAKCKAHDRRRAKCRCEAYPWPHRPAGGYCRHPDPPAARWKDIKAAQIAERIAKWRARFGEPTPAQLAELARPNRPYRNRYAGLRRQIAHNNGLHPIRDRAAIDALMPRALALAKELHGQYPKCKYRNMEITDNGITGYWTAAGPTM